MKRFLYISLFLLTLSLIVSAQEGADAEANRVVIDGQYFYVYTVRPGDTLYSLSRKYGVTEGDIKKNNPQTIEGLRAGEAIKIPAPEPDPLPRNIRNRTSSNNRVEVHTVNYGERSYSIAKRYGVTVDDLVESNPGFDPTDIRPGQRILIPRDLVGTSTTAQIDTTFSRYTEALSQATDGWNYYLVKKNDTLYSLARDLAVPEDSLRAYNRPELARGLQAGSMLRYPVREEQRKRPEEESPEEQKEPEKPKNDRIRFPNERREAHSFDAARPVQVSLMLPFTTNGQEEPSMAEYYRGTLLALEDLKANNISVDLSVFDTRQSDRAVRDVLNDNALSDADLIIGPRYNDSFETVARFAARKQIPIVSPQWLVDSDEEQVFQARPAPEHQYDKLKPYLTPDYNVILINSSTGIDAGFKQAVEKNLPSNAVRVDYTGRGSSSAIRNALSRDRENIIVVPTDNANTTEAILATIGSIQNNVTATTGRGYPIQVIGSPQWGRFENNDSESFFKVQAMYVTLYYVNRTNPVVADFDRRYLSAFGTLPTLFSYRGYDVAKLFVSAICQYGNRYAEHLNWINAGLLVPYHFRQTDEGKWINDEWVLVRYRNDYMIEVK